jgi:hypothetical protein
MRCSAATSVTIGTTLELGARIAKNQAPANAAGARRSSPHAVPASRQTMTRPGIATCATPAGAGHS